QKRSAETPRHPADRRGRSENKNAGLKYPNLARRNLLSIAMGPELRGLTEFHPRLPRLETYELAKRPATIAAFGSNSKPDLQINCTASVIAGGAQSSSSGRTQ